MRLVTRLISKNLKSLIDSTLPIKTVQVAEESQVSQMLQECRKLFPQLETLELMVTTGSAEDATQLASYEFPHLKNLIIGCSGHPSGLVISERVLPKLTALTSLHIESCEEEENQKALYKALKCDNFRSLQNLELEFAFSRDQPQDICALAAIAFSSLCNLTRLDLCGSGFHLNSFSSIFWPDSLPLLQDLSFSATSPYDVEAPPFMLPNWPNLQSLKVDFVGPNGLNAVTSAPWFSALTYLELSLKTRWGEMNLEGLQRAASLQELYLNYTAPENTLSLVGIELPNLKKLEVIVEPYMMILDEEDELSFIQVDASTFAKMDELRIKCDVYYLTDSLNLDKLPRLNKLKHLTIYSWLTREEALKLSTFWFPRFEEIIVIVRFQNPSDLLAFFDMSSTSIVGEPKWPYLRKLSLYLNFEVDPLVLKAFLRNLIAARAHLPLLTSFTLHSGSELDRGSLQPMYDAIESGKWSNIVFKV